MLNTETIARIAGRPANDNLRSVARALTDHGTRVGLARPHRLAHFLAQVLHETGRGRWDRELWGPTPAQARYEGRADLGNDRPGDGARYKGRGAIQITGRDNYRQFTRWARSLDPRAPDFEADPEAVLTDPWEGLSAIWYWSTRNLNAIADEGDVDGVGGMVNAGRRGRMPNGAEDRRALYTRAALVLLGHPPDAVAVFQRRAGLRADGIAGPLTRAALHRALLALPPLASQRPEPRPASRTAHAGFWASLTAALARLFRRD